MAGKWVRVSLGVALPSLTYASTEKNSKNAHTVGCRLRLVCRDYGGAQDKMSSPSPQFTQL